MNGTRHLFGLPFTSFLLSLAFSSIAPAAPASFRVHWLVTDETAPSPLGQQPMDVTTDISNIPIVERVSVIFYTSSVGKYNGRSANGPHTLFLSGTPHTDPNLKPGCSFAPTSNPLD
jgi:hypothetical protein